MKKDSKPIFLFKMVALACILTLAVCLAADALAEPLGFRIVMASGGLNVRATPEITGLHRYTLEDSQVVLVLETQGNWARVALNRPPFVPIGWACMDYLK